MTHRCDPYLVAQLEIISSSLLKIASGFVPLSRSVWAEPCRNMGSVTGLSDVVV